MALELSLGMGGISTGGDGDSVPGRAGAEHLRKVPRGVPTLGRGQWQHVAPGGEVGRERFLLFNFRGLIFFPRS